MKRDKRVAWFPAACQTNDRPGMTKSPGLSEAMTLTSSSRSGIPS